MEVPPLTQKVQLGAVILDKYRVLRQIGRGGMGIVVEAEHIDLRERVAIKFMRADPTGNALPRFLREARAAARIRSEHVVRVIDVGRLDDERPFMVMEYLEGKDLARKLAEEGIIPVEEAIHYTLQACMGLAEAHASGVLHRDLKPSNLLLTRRSDGSSLIKILDFGVSKMAGATDLTSVKQVLGSLLYMSPEQLECSREVDQRTDIYSLGATLYELLTGRTPFTSANPMALSVKILKATRPPIRDFRPDLPIGFSSVVDRMLDRSRDARYSYVADVATALAPFAPGDASTVERINRIPRRAIRSAPDEPDEPEPSSAHRPSIRIDPLEKTVAAQRPPRPQQARPPSALPPPPPRSSAPPSGKVPVIVTPRGGVIADLTPLDESSDNLEVIHDLRALMRRRERTKDLVSDRLGLGAVRDPGTVPGLGEAESPSVRRPRDGWPLLESEGGEVDPAGTILGLDLSADHRIAHIVSESVSISVDALHGFDVGFASASFNDDGAVLVVLTQRLRLEAAGQPELVSRVNDAIELLSSSQESALVLGSVESLWNELGRTPAATAVLAYLLWQSSPASVSRTRAYSLATSCVVSMPGDALVHYCAGVMAFGLNRRIEAVRALSRAIDLGLDADQALHSAALLEALHPELGETEAEVK
ncbi:MAG: serine/threonine-protein kinase [Polyangiaceae bacterium]